MTNSNDTTDIDTDQTNSETEPNNFDFAIIQNELIRSPTLSCKAFKLLCLGLSHSGKWKFKIKQLATCFKEGEHTVEAAVKELRVLGYLHLKARGGGDENFNGHKWFWFKKPISKEEFKKFYRDGGFQVLREIGGSENRGDIRRLTPKKTKKNNNNGIPKAKSSHKHSKPIDEQSEQAKKPPKKKKAKEKSQAKLSPVVVSSLRECGVSEKMDNKIAKMGYTEDEILKACLAVKLHNSDTPDATIRLALKESWKPSEKKKVAKIATIAPPSREAEAIFNKALALKSSDIVGGGSFMGNQYSIVIDSVERGKFTIKANSESLKADVNRAFGYTVFND